MKTIELKKTAALLVPAAVMSLAFQVQAADMKPIVNDSAKKVVLDSEGKCVLSAGGRAAEAPDCGLMAPKAAPEGDADGDGVVDSKDECPNTPAGAPVDARGCALDSDGDGVPDYKDKCPGTRKGAKVDMNGCEIIDSVTIDLTNDEFDFDSAKLKPAMMSALDDVAARVNASAGDESLMIVGHTDSVGSEAYNQGLSERRAQSVADYLAGQGISAGKMSTMGKGESSPIADNGTSEGRAKNRRVEIMTH
ncbi:MAG: OmpA family protein [Sedimenticola sp.]